MPPRKRARTKESDAEAGDDISSVTIELGDGETDTNNLGYLTLVTEAWETVQGHNVFARAAEANASAIAGGQGGMQAPFKQQDFERALGVGGEPSHIFYIYGINLAWIDFTLTATSGIPVRASAVQQLCKSVFGKPRPLEQIHVASPWSIKEL